MKFNFKIQSYQTEAVQSVVDSFAGQRFSDGISYRRDIGDVKEKQNYSQAYLDYETSSGEVVYKDDFDEAGFKNSKITLTPNELLNNIRKVQQNNNVLLSESLLNDLGACSLDIEMETGTGKTYVYIKTMFELNRKYGWSKFIVVVPSIAIREGVNKSFEITQDHFI